MADMLPAHLNSLETDHSHGPETVQEVEVISVSDDGINWVVKTKAGIVCRARFNAFCARIFADDVNEIISTGEVQP